MKNILEYYYGIIIDNIFKKNDYYKFKMNNNNYIFKKIDNIDNIILKNNLANFIKSKMKFNIIIPNKFNSLISNVDNFNYVLIEDNIDKKININDITLISSININNYYNILSRDNWEELWSIKIDYYEKQVRENIKKYPLIRESFDYFIGLAENAISYLVNTKKECKIEVFDNKVISHNSLFDSIYDPFNIIIDHKARDIAEYIKYSYWNNNTNLYNELDYYFYNNIYSVYGIRVLISRIIYPSFYFDIYDKIISDKKEEKYLINIISKINDYEIFLSNILSYFQNKFNIPPILWIKKKRTNPH